MSEVAHEQVHKLHKPSEDANTNKMIPFGSTKLGRIVFVFNMGSLLLNC